MRAKYLRNAAGEWKGFKLSPYCEFDVPEHMQDLVANNPNFAVLVEPRKPGRPRKVTDGNA